ncbi:MAG: formate dehydrogenase accessory sulfurtransferase FdhD [Verrucomicrobiaceae bacterium]|nr:formate dehydrogenase accessory sulfurtransferase FdhD [Verrucomicrobiaceae bacterium]
MSRAPFSAALIAGGRSTRMGRDKAFLPWPNQPLWEVQVEKLHSLGPDRVFIACRGDQEINPSSAERVLDPPDEDAGPLPAVLRCLRAAGQRVLVMAVDMPLVTAALMDRLLTHEVGCCYSKGGGIEPMLAVVTPEMIPVLEEEGTRSGSMQAALSRAAELGICQVLPVSDEEAPLLLNANEPRDLPLLLTKLTSAAGQQPQHDFVAVEEPLEIRVEGRSVAVVMRTPGNDRELAAGFLVSEGVVKSARDVLEISQCPQTTDSKGNIVDVLLGGAVVNWDHLTRHVFSASSCGLCGKTSLDSVFVKFPPVNSALQISAELLWSLPRRLREAQPTFDRTGGLHACAIFDQKGDLIVLREDVGRHNALDKVLGHGLLSGSLPWSEHILLLSGRVSFEMMQKALAAGVPVVAAISAPTSLAVDFARESRQTLIGFLRDGTMNIYAGKERLK